MDNETERQLRQTIDHLKSVAVEDIDFDDMDPVAKMMLVAVLYEGQKLRDYIEQTPERVRDRYCADFIPFEDVQAIPAITMLKPSFRNNAQQSTVTVGSGAAFTFKRKEEKLQLNYVPFLKTLLLPCTDVFVLTPHTMHCAGGTFPIDMPTTNRLWVGLVTDVEIESLRGLSMLIRGTGGLLPDSIRLIPPFADRTAAADLELATATMHEMENIGILEPFDSQQASGQLFAFVSKWKENLLNLQEGYSGKENAALMYVTDARHDRDLFKPQTYPKAFQQWLENDALDRFQPNTVWLQVDFPEGYEIPDTLHIDINVVPVVNVDVNSVTLSRTEPIVKLQKQDNAFFLRILETTTAAHRQGFNWQTDEIIVRDFDAASYHEGDLYRDVRNLSRRFMDDYYAFMKFKGINDGNAQSLLRKTINTLTKGVGEENDKYRFDSGTYVMRNISMEDQTTTTKVTYLTTMGEAGNTPLSGDVMEHRKLPALNQKVDVIIDAMGGRDKASPDARHELLRYYALTNDRLYTRMDIDAFLRKEIMLTFGAIEYQRITTRITIEGNGGPAALRRGLYIDIDFKDAKNYYHARRIAFDALMRQRITNHACIAMPIIVTLKNLEG